MFGAPPRYTSVGAEPDIPVKEINHSKSPYTQQGMASAQQAHAALGPSVLECIKNHRA